MIFFQNRQNPSNYCYCCFSLFEQLFYGRLLFKYNPINSWAHKPRDHPLSENTPDVFWFIICDSLGENGHHRLIYLKAWFPVDGTLWEGSGGGTLLEEACHWGLGFLRFHISTPFPELALLLSHVICFTLLNSFSSLPFPSSLPSSSFLSSPSLSSSFFSLPSSSFPPSAPSPHSSSPHSTLGL